MMMKLFEALTIAGLTGLMLIAGSMEADLIGWGTAFLLTAISLTCMTLGYMGGTRR